MLKRILLYTGIALAGLALIIVGALWAMNEIRPEGRPGPAADALARKMEQSLNVAAWDSTGAVRWSFRGSHEHLWDRERHVARVKWDDNEVLVNLIDRSGLAWQDGQAVEGTAGEKLVQTAWEYWVNDAFWLVAPFKAFDAGTSRAIVTNDSGTDQLLVTYGSGGATPGDAYLWQLDEAGKPLAWKMWVSIIPVGGLKVPWSAWTEISTGALLCHRHEGLLSLELQDVEGTHHLQDWFPTADPFAPLLERNP